MVATTIFHLKRKQWPISVSGAAYSAESYIFKERSKEVSKTFFKFIEWKTCKMKGPLKIGFSAYKILSKYSFFSNFLMDRKEEVIVLTLEVRSRLGGIGCLTQKLAGEFSKRGYATYNIVKPDSKNIDPNAKKNNPPIANKGQHAEISRGTCNTPECKEINCGSLPTQQPTQSPSTLPRASCGNEITEKESVGHLTSGNPQISHGKVAAIDTQTNVVGQVKAQNGVLYYTPHLTGNTIEAFPVAGQSTGKGTDFIHDSKSPQRITTIINETKNK